MSTSERPPKRVSEERRRLEERIEAEDRRLVSEGVPPESRTAILFGLLVPQGTVIGGLGAHPDNPFQVLQDWYAARYGGRAVGEIGPIGRLPFLHRGGIFTMTIPLRFGNPELDPIHLVEDMSTTMAVGSGKDGGSRSGNSGGF